MKTLRRNLYEKYIAIVYRCTKQKHPAYKWYWWRWIKCEWKSFEDFISDMWWIYKQWLTIERLNNNWNYCKENCKWITQKEQCNNRSSNWNITYNWITKTFWERVNELWIPRTTLQWRLYRWWSLEDAFTRKAY